MTDSGPGYENDDSFEDILEQYLETRAESVAKSTWKQDCRESERLVAFLGAGATWEEFCYLFPAYLQTVRNKRHIVGEDKTNRTLASMRSFVEWLLDEELLEPEDFEQIESALLGPVTKREALTYTFRLALSETHPKVWRDVQIPGRYRLNQVHKMLQLLFGWQDYHLHEFEIGARIYTDMETYVPDYERDERDERIPLAQALGVSKSWIYRYDFGDSWEVQATLLETTSGDADAPACLAGEMAGPPEDCGGTPGFESLKAILANPKDPEYRYMKEWAPTGYDPRAFSAEEMTKKLVKKFGRKSALLKAPDGATLAGYPLSKMKVLGAAVAALKERSPQTLEQIQARLQELGYPLKAGQDSLRRAIAATEAARKRTDGAYELVEGPALRRILSRMNDSHQEGMPKPTSETVEVEPIVGPVTWEELESAKPHGVFPPPMSNRRQLILILEALGGRATLDQTLSELVRVMPRASWLKADDVQRTLKGTHAVEIEGQHLRLVSNTEDLQKARQQFRDWMMKYRKSELERSLFRGKSQERAAARREELMRERRRLSTLSRAIVCVLWEPERFVMGLLTLPNKEPQWFIEAEAARGALSQIDVVVGLDLKTGFERMGWTFQDMLVVDASPPFKSIPTRAGRRKTLSVAEAIKLGTGRSLSEPGKVASWVAKADHKRYRAALGNDLDLLYQYWRFGVIHGAVLRGAEWMPVSWNICMDVTLRMALRWCIEDQLPLPLSLRDGTQGAFVPAELDPSYYEDDLLSGCWLNRTEKVEIRSAQILDFQYPYELKEDRLFTPFSFL